MDNEINSLKRSVDKLYIEIQKNAVEESSKMVIDTTITELHSIVQDMEKSNITIARADLLDNIKIPDDITREELDKIFSSSISIPLIKCVLKTKKD